MDNPKLIVIVGPTASGKTDLSIKLAKEFNGEIICADSRTIYRGMNIGTAKPQGEKLETGEKAGIESLFAEKPYLVDGVEHWGIDLVDPGEDFTAAQFKKYADQKITEIIKRGHLPILVGGTGLYVSAVVDNLTFTDAASDEKLRQELDQLSNDDLLARLKKNDPEAADTIDLFNRRRLIRAIEIVEISGKTLAAQQTKGKPKYQVLMIGIEVAREELYERIDERVDAMIAAGLVDEVRDLKNQFGCEANAMTGIGYRQICAFFQGAIKLKDAIELIKTDTRHYAKRQLTWFKRDDRINWLENFDQAQKLVSDFIK